MEPRAREVANLRRWAPCVLACLSAGCNEDELRMGGDARRPEDMAVVLVDLDPAGEVADLDRVRDPMDPCPNDDPGNRTEVAGDGTGVALPLEGGARGWDVEADQIVRDTDGFLALAPGSTRGSIRYVVRGCD